MSADSDDYGYIFQSTNAETLNSLGKTLGEEVFAVLVLDETKEKVVDWGAIAYVQVLFVVAVTGLKIVKIRREFPNAFGEISKEDVETKIDIHNIGPESNLFEKDLDHIPGLKTDVVSLVDQKAFLIKIRRFLIDIFGKNHEGVFVFLGEEEKEEVFEDEEIWNVYNAMTGVWALYEWLRFHNGAPIVTTSET